MIHMNKQDYFNKLFTIGISYENYFNKIDKYKDRMNSSFSAGKKAVEKLTQEQIARLNEKIHVLCIAESWCIDCANGVPLIALLAETVTKWDFRIASRDQFKEEFSIYYSTAGRMKIPVVIFADEDGDEIIRWVERPIRSYQLLGQLRDQNLSKEEFIQKYHDTREFEPPVVSQAILNELIFIAEKATSIVHVNPPSRKNSR